MCMFTGRVAVVISAAVVTVISYWQMTRDKMVGILCTTVLLFFRYNGNYATVYLLLFKAMTNTVTTFTRVVQRAISLTRCSSLLMTQRAHRSRWTLRSTRFSEVASNTCQTMPNATSRPDSTQWWRYSFESDKLPTNDDVVMTICDIELIKTEILRGCRHLDAIAHVKWCSMFLLSFNLRRDLILQPGREIKMGRRRLPNRVRLKYYFVFAQRYLWS